METFELFIAHSSVHLMVLLLVYWKLAWILVRTGDRLIELLVEELLSRTRRSLLLVRLRLI